MADSAASTAAHGAGPAATAAAGQEPLSVVRVAPEQFKIDVVLNEEVFLELTLHNTSSSLCTFKVKTTARDRYLLRPTQDYIPPHGSRQCKIVMAAMRAYPDLSNPKNLKDKFLVQATNIDAEVPDLTKFWKELETQHNPKAGVYKYAETKIKCKLSVPAKYRAADATKRGEEAEQAAAAAAAAAERNAQMALSMQQQQQQQQQQVSAAVAQPRMDDYSERANESGEGARRKPSNDAADFAAMALTAPPSQQQQQIATTAPIPLAAAPVTLVPMASPAVSAAIAAATAAPLTAAPSSGSGVSGDANSVSRQLAASEYAELMEFVVKTTAQLEKERAERESWEGRAQQAAQALAQTQIKLENTESKLIAAREELKRAASSSSASSGSKVVDDGSDLTRRRGKSEGKDSAPLSDDDDRSSTAKKLAAATAAVSPVSSTGSGPSTPLGGALASKQPAGLTLPLWQIALMALVCFVLGRIFG